MGATNYTTSGTGIFYGDYMSTGSSKARKYIEITAVSFNSSTGVTTVTYDVGIQVHSGNFGGSSVNYGGWSGYCSSVKLYGAGWYGFHTNLTVSIAHDSTKKFYEWCGYTSSAAGGYIDSEVYLTFQPSLPTYAITYSANSGTGTTSSQTKTWGTAITLNANGFSRSGYTFKRWNTSADDTGTAYGASAPYEANAAAAFYAIWNRTVTYDANGGSDAPDEQTEVATSAITLSSATPLKTGYDFVSWNTASDGSGTSYAPGDSYAANNPDMTLYAQWRSAASITSLTATRCDSSGTQDDEGTYAAISCVWENPNNDATITVTKTPQGGSASSVTVSTASSDTTRTSTARPSGFDTDTQYTITAELTVSGTVVASKSILVTKAAFVLDFKAGGGAIGIGTAAPSSGLEIGMNTLVSGTLTVANQTRYYVLAAPSSGNGTAAFRKLVAGDIPNISAAKITSGTLAVANGGTGGATAAAALTNILGGKAVLYNDSTETGTNGTVTLSDVASNYNHMRIYFYGKAGGSTAYKRYGSTDVYSPNGKYVSLAAVSPQSPSSTAVDISCKVVLISGSQITTARATAGNVQSSPGAGLYNEVYITRVEAWNE